MKKLLVTGFEPFGQREENSSWECADRLPVRIGSMELIKRRLPVVWGESEKRLNALLDELSPDAVLCLGMSGASVIHIERVAVNLREAERADNAGVVLADEPVLSGGPAAYFATLPYHEMLFALKEAAIPAQFSFSAGTYLCNAVLYTALHACLTLHKPAGFIHLPPLFDGKEGMELDTLVHGVTLCAAAVEKAL